MIHFLTPAFVGRWHQKMATPLLWLCLLTVAVGALWGLFIAPPDYRMGEAVRILYVHVPASWMAMQVYAMMAGASLGAMIWRNPVLGVLPKALAPVGCLYTALSLVTGALWGKPMWGAWWVWDARLTSMFVLLLIYGGYLVFMKREQDRDQPSDASYILVLVGALNLPLIKWSVTWFHTLHQPASISRLDKPAMDASMLWPLSVMVCGYFLFVLYVGLNQWMVELNKRKVRALQRKILYAGPRDFSKTQVSHA